MPATLRRRGGLKRAAATDGPVPGLSYTEHEATTVPSSTANINDERANETASEVSAPPLPAGPKRSFGEARSLPPREKRTKATLAVARVDVSPIEIVNATPERGTSNHPTPSHSALQEQSRDIRERIEKDLGRYVTSLRSDSECQEPAIGDQETQDAKQAEVEEATGQEHNEKEEALKHCDDALELIVQPLLHYRLILAKERAKLRENRRPRLGCPEDLESVFRMLLERHLPTTQLQAVGGAAKLLLGLNRQGVNPARNNPPIIVTVAGASAGGKTTLLTLIQQLTLLDWSDLGGLQRSRLNPFRSHRSFVSIDANSRASNPGGTLLRELYEALRKVPKDGHSTLTLSIDEAQSKTLSFFESLKTLFEAGRFQVRPEGMKKTITVDIPANVTLIIAIITNTGEDDLTAKLHSKWPDMSTEEQERIQRNVLKKVVRVSFNKQESWWSRLQKGYTLLFFPLRPEDRPAAIEKLLRAEYDRLSGRHTEFGETVAEQLLGLWVEEDERIARQLLPAEKPERPTDIPSEKPERPTDIPAEKPERPMDIRWITSRLHKLVNEYRNTHPQLGSCLLMHSLEKKGRDYKFQGQSLLSCSGSHNVGITLDRQTGVGEDNEEKDMEENLDASDLAEAHESILEEEEEDLEEEDCEEDEEYILEESEGEGTSSDNSTRWSTGKHNSRVTSKKKHNGGKVDAKNALLEELQRMPPAELKKRLTAICDAAKQKHASLVSDDLVKIHELDEQFKHALGDRRVDSTPLSLPSGSASMLADFQDADAVGSRLAYYARQEERLPVLELYLKRTTGQILTRHFQERKKNDKHYGSGVWFATHMQTKYNVTWGGQDMGYRRRFAACCVRLPSLPYLRVATDFSWSDIARKLLSPIEEALGKGRRATCTPALKKRR